MRRPLPLAFLAILVVGCSGPALPNGYEVSESATNREWLRAPDGTLVHPGLLSALFAENDRLIGVFHPATGGGEPVGYPPLNGDCLVALQIDTTDGGVRQIEVTEAYSRGSAMKRVWSSDRPCDQASSSMSQ
jgi:hypothetical protein